MISAAVGNTYGGLTKQGMPVVLEMTKNRREVVEATAALRLTCTAGGFYTFAPTMFGLSVTKKGRFSESFGPQTTRYDDGTTSDLEGRISGKLNNAKTRISGTSSVKEIYYDGAGAVTDTCTSGSVSWKAKQ